MLERQGAARQIAVMEYLSVEEQADVARVLALLAEASKRRKRHEYPEPPTAEP